MRLEAIAMKKLGLALVLLVLAVSACDNKLPPTKAPGAEQSSYASNPVMSTETVGN
ncbi:msl7943 [Mesorhizobium japonicum MAFF 303099]|uniref:Msl7943 protein n=2 Tax=Mesorhizobium japonicum TaxID=2066070 RepID=Q984M0_RHILO|nr:msl7943 [Mesorhizobium japonicum MAFF 303099]